MLDQAQKSQLSSSDEDTQNSKPGDPGPGGG